MNDQRISFSVFLKTLVNLINQDEITYPSVVPIYRSLMREANEVDIGVESLLISMH